MNKRGVSGILSVFAALLAISTALPAQAQQAATYTNPLDSQSDVANWYFYDYYGWWAVDDTPIEGHNSPASLNNNNGSDIDGDYNYAYFESDVIDIAGLDSPILSFWCLNDLPDFYSGQFYGYQYMYMYDENWNYGWGWSFGPYQEIDCGSSGDWHQHQIPIPQEIVSLGGVRLTCDTYWEVWYQGAGMQGWFVDNLQILVADVTPPDSVTDLAATNPTLNTIDLSWSSPFDDDISGTTASFDLRMSTSAINASNFANATQLTGEPTPDVEGTPHNIQITNLTENTTYHFAIQTTDIAGNVSSVSNVPSVATLAPPPPPPPPPSSGGAVEFEEPKDDILPCSAGTGAAPTSLLALAGLIALLALAKGLRK